MKYYIRDAPDHKIHHLNQNDEIDFLKYEDDEIDDIIDCFT